MTIRLGQDDARGIVHPARRVVKRADRSFTMHQGAYRSSRRSVRRRQVGVDRTPSRNRCRLGGWRRRWGDLRDGAVRCC